MKKQTHKYHYLTARIFAQCDIYFIDDTIEQAKYEIDMAIREYDRGNNIKEEVKL